jgi:sugar phosphate isomerase/epimerase
MMENLLLSVAFQDLAAAVPMAEQQGLGIEITQYETGWLMGDGAPAEAEAVGRDLAGRGILVTCHGPLYDLNPGSLDPTIRAYTETCFRRGVEVAARLGAKKIVFHTCYNPLLPDGVLAGWKELSRPVWRAVLEQAAGLKVVVCLENSYEPSAEFFRDLFDTFDDGTAQMCFDPAHVHLYSRDGQSAWVTTMRDRITHIHLNDNSGSSDDHLALGSGNMPYRGFLKELCGAFCAATIVLEMPLERVPASLAFLKSLGLDQGR